MSNKQRQGDRAGKTPSQRQLRVGEEIRHVLADLFRRGEFRDPELQDLNVTVSEVRISPDLKNATAFIMPLGGGHPEIVAALGRAAPFLRGQIAKALRLQFAPRIGFQLDTSFDYAQRIGRLLHQPAVARDLDAEGVPMDREDRLEDETDMAPDADLAGDDSPGGETR